METTGVSSERNIDDDDQSPLTQSQEQDLTGGGIALQVHQTVTPAAPEKVPTVAYSQGLEIRWTTGHWQ